MKTLTSLFSVLLATCLLTFVSCSSDEYRSDTEGSGGSTPNESFVKLLPVKITDNVTRDIKIFEYDSLLRIKSIRRYKGVQSIDQVTIEYDDLSPYSVGEIPVIKAIDETSYNYEAGLSYIIRITNMFGSESGEIYSFDAKLNRVLKYEEIYHSEPVTTATFTYDSKGNVIKRLSEFGSSDMIEGYDTNTYSYDNQNNIFRAVNMPSWTYPDLFLFYEAIYANCDGHAYTAFEPALSAVNNMRSIVYERPGGCKLEMKFEYEYNEFGYPTLVTPIFDWSLLPSDEKPLNPRSIEYIPASQVQ